MSIILLVRILVGLGALSLVLVPSAPAQVAYEAYLKASNAEADDRFGGAPRLSDTVAIDGNTIVVGARRESSAATGTNGDQADNGALSSGAAYVFELNGANWVQTGYLKAYDTRAGDFFGSSVDVSGDTIVVGAQYEDSNATGVNGPQANLNATNAGAAYVYVKSGTAWNSGNVYLKASNTEAGDQFGFSVAIDEDTIVVGAFEENSSATGVNGDQADNGASDAGAAYVFTRSGTSWTQEAYLKASNTAVNAEFGRSVAIAGNTLVVGSPGAEAAYVFVRSGTTWTQEAHLTGSAVVLDDLFGYSVAISGDTIVAGAWGDSGKAGAAYVFARSGSTWTEQAYLKASNADALDQFGRSVGVTNDTVVVGALAEASDSIGASGDESDNSLPQAGAAYIFTRVATTWSQTEYLKASNTGINDRFGHPVAISDGKVVACAAREASAATGVNGNEADDSAFGTGAAYVIALDQVPLAVVGTDRCSGDGGDQLGCTNCPCMNNASVATVGGCLNSAGTSARLEAAGDTSVSIAPFSATDLRFTVSGAPPTSFCILNSGDALAPSNAANPCFGLDSGTQAAAFDGLRCAILNTRRHGGRSADANGEVGVTNGPWGGGGGPPVGIAVAGGGFASGQTRYFQVINRDDPLLGCMRGLNTSQAVEVTFTP